MRIAADDVQLALPELNLGMIPGSGGTQRLARLVGLGRAKDIVMRRRRVGAEEALAIGLVTEVVPSAELDAAVARLVDDLATLSPLALTMAKRVLDHAYDGPLHLGLELEGLAYGFLRTTYDFREGVSRRSPRSEGPSSRDASETAASRSRRESLCLSAPRSEPTGRPRRRARPSARPRPWG